MKIYFLEGFSWIANAGVVPTFLSFAFLFAPCLFNLFARFASVTLVLDTILKLLFRRCFLPRYTRYVKIFFFCPIFSLLASESWIISKGEHKEINIGQYTSFSISNKDVVAHKYYKRSNRLLLKGKKLGFSELLIVQGDRKRKVIQIYVLSKKKQLDILHLAQTLRSIGLKTEIAGPLITVSGEIESFENYLLLKKLTKKNRSYLHMRGELSKPFRKELIGKIYQILFNQYVDNISCSTRFFTILCQYPISNPPAKSILDMLKSDLHVKLIPINHPHSLKNYKINLKLILMEKVNGQEINLGLSKISTTYKDLFEKGVSALIEKNSVKLANHELNLSSLAEPKLLLTLGKPAAIQVGADIPFQKPIYGSEATTTEWKFAGLKVDLSLEKIGKSLQLSYQTEFTKPSQEGLSGSKQKSVVTLTENKPEQLFEIGFKSSGDGKESLPFLGSIPILGHLFSSKSSQSNYKKIIGVINLE